MKTCTSCGTTRDQDEFPAGLSICRACHDDTTPLIQDMRSVIVTAAKVSNKGRQKVAFAPIIDSPLRTEIDTLLFKEHAPIQAVHEWLVHEKHDVSISYMMLYRYFKRLKTTALESVVQLNAVESTEQNWDNVSVLIQRGMKQMREGVFPLSGKEIMTAIKWQSDLIDRYGGIPGHQDILKDAKRRMNMLVDIVLGIVTPEQGQRIAVAIAETPDLLEWTTTEE